MKQKEDDVWSLVTAAVASLTVGVVLYNTIHMFARHHQAIAKENLPHRAYPDKQATPCPAAADGNTNLPIPCCRCLCSHQRDVSEQVASARFYREYVASGGHLQDMIVHIEQHADYDGVAVRCGSQTSV